jgi:hypothetical protein
MRARTLVLFFTVFIFTLSVIKPVYSVGIGQFSNQRISLFTPGLEKSYTFYLYDSDNIGASVEGDLAEYTTIIDPNPNGGPRNIQVVLKMPEYIEPGMHTIYLTASQVSNGQTASVGGVAQVRTSLNVYALYPGKRPEFTGISADDLNINEKSAIKISVINNGEETIDAANGLITVYDEGNNTIAVLHTDSQSVKPFETQTLTAILDASEYNLSVGKYKATGSLTSDGEAADYVMNTTFIVGQMKVDIVDSTPDVIVNATNKYYITLESDWSGDINDVYAKITMPNGKVIKSPNIDLVKPSQGSKAAGQIEMYMETAGIAIGTYDVDVTVYYRGLTSTRKIKLNIIDGKAPVIEKPRLITPTTIFIGVGILIILFVLIYFLVFRHGGGSGGNTSSGNNSIQSNNTDVIRPPSL